MPLTIIVVSSNNLYNFLRILLSMEKKIYHLSNRKIHSYFNLALMKTKILLIIQILKISTTACNCKL